MSSRKQDAPQPRVKITHSRDLTLSGMGQIQLADLEALTQEARRLGYADDAKVTPLYLTSAMWTGGHGQLITVSDAKKEVAL